MILNSIKQAFLTIILVLFGNDKKPKHLNDFSEEDFDKVKYKVRIAFVDDEEITHIGRLQRDGYKITQYEDIENIDEFIAKKYDVLILDIQGVGQYVSETTEGWGILKYLKSSCPHLVVIIFTGADWSIAKYKDLADTADDFISKDLEFLDFKSKLDSAIRKAFSPKFHFDIFKKHISQEISDEEAVKKIERIVARYHNNKEKGLSEIKKITTNGNILKQVDTLLIVTNHISEVVSK